MEVNLIPVESEETREDQIDQFIAPRQLPGKPVAA
jgi:hypothetical protein